MKAKELSQGDVILVSFDPSMGHEQKGYRLALVVSSQRINWLTNGIIKVVPISTTNNDFPLHIPLPGEMKTTGKVLLQQEITLDLNSRNFKLTERAPKEFVSKVVDILIAEYE